MYLLSLEDERYPAEVMDRLEKDFAGQGGDRPDAEEEGLLDRTQSEVAEFTYQYQPI